MSEGGGGGGKNCIEANHRVFHLWEKGGRMDGKRNTMTPRFSSKGGETFIMHYFRKFKYGVS